MKPLSLFHLAPAPTRQAAVNSKRLNPKAPPVYKPVENNVNRKGTLLAPSASPMKGPLQAKPVVAARVQSQNRNPAALEGASPLRPSSPSKAMVQPKFITASAVEQRPAPAAYACHPSSMRSASAPFLQPKRSGVASVVQRMETDTVESAFPSVGQREALPIDCEDLHTTLVKLEEIILWIGEESKNQIDKAPMESFNFTCSIKKGSVGEMISRCRREAEHLGSSMTHGLAWYNAGGNQAHFNKYGPHITFASPRKTNQSRITKYVAHHVFFLNGETRDVK